MAAHWACSKKKETNDAYEASPCRWIVRYSGSQRADGRVGARLEPNEMGGQYADPHDLKRS